MSELNGTRAHQDNIKKKKKPKKKALPSTTDTNTTKQPREPKHSPGTRYRSASVVVAKKPTRKKKFAHSSSSGTLILSQNMQDGIVMQPRSVQEFDKPKKKLKKKKKIKKKPKSTESKEPDLTITKPSGKKKTKVKEKPKKKYFEELERPIARCVSDKKISPVGFASRYLSMKRATHIEVPTEDTKGAIIKKYDDFPRNVKTIVENAKLDPQDIEDHFDILLNVLYFQKKILYEFSQQTRDFQKSKRNRITIREGITDVTEEVLVNHDTNPLKSYKMISQSGEGGFGRVFAARSEINGHKGKVAIKRMDHVTEKEKRHNIGEIAFLNVIDHPNIVKYYASYIVKNEMWVVMEFMEGGTLTEAVKGHNFTEKQIAYVAFELLKGLEYLHDKRLAHRDLKSGNVMMTTDGCIKLIDFGLCVDLNDGPRLDMVGSPFWMAPEMVQRKLHSYPVDIWSFAISLLELANKTHPFAKSSLKAMFTYGTKGLPEPLEDASKWSEVFQDFIIQCLSFDQNNRPSATELLSHPFLIERSTKKEMAVLLKRVFMNTVFNSVMM